MRRRLNINRRSSESFRTWQRWHDVQGIAAGRLRHYVTIQDPVEEQQAGTGDDGAVEILDWSDTFANVPAEVDFGAAREYNAAAQLQAQITAVVMLRWRPGLHAKQRIRYVGPGGREYLFNVAGALPDAGSGRTFVRIPVTEGVNDG